MMIGGEFNTPGDWIRVGNAVQIADSYAAAHGGVAPVLVFADAGGTFNNDTECVDGPRGNAASHLTRTSSPSSSRPTASPATRGPGASSAGRWAAPARSTSPSCTPSSSTRSTTSRATPARRSGPSSRPSTGSTAGTRRRGRSTTRRRCSRVTPPTPTRPAGSTTAPTPAAGSAGTAATGRVPEVGLRVSVRRVSARRAAASAAGRRRERGHRRSRRRGSDRPGAARGAGALRPGADPGDRLHRRHPAGPALVAVRVDRVLGRAAVDVGAARGAGDTRRTPPSRLRGSCPG